MKQSLLIALVFVGLIVAANAEAPTRGYKPFANMGPSGADCFCGNISAYSLILKQISTQ